MELLPSPHELFLKNSELWSCGVAEVTAGVCKSERRSHLILVKFYLSQSATCETATSIKILLAAALTSTIPVQDCAMGSGCYSLVATALLVMNFERTRSLQDSCSNCPAGENRINVWASALF